jgi:hypothetical protein
MELIYEKIGPLPLEVRMLGFIHDGWIVGSGALYLVGVDKFEDPHQKPADWDILVPPEIFRDVVHMFPVGTSTNTWGGLKYSRDGLILDVWPEDLGHYFMSAHDMHGDRYAVHLRSKRVAYCPVNRS